MHCSRLFEPLNIQTVQGHVCLYLPRQSHLEHLLQPPTKALPPDGQTRLGSQQYPLAWPQQYLLVWSQQWYRPTSPFSHALAFIDCAVDMCTHVCSLPPPDIFSPTPHYNNSLIVETTGLYICHLETIFLASQTCDAFADTVLLLKIWLRQRQLDQVGGAWWTGHDGVWWGVVGECYSIVPNRMLMTRNIIECRYNYKLFSFAIGSC